MVRPGGGYMGEERISGRCAVESVQQRIPVRRYGLRKHGGLSPVAET